MICQQTNSWSVNLQTGQLAEWQTRVQDDSLIMETFDGKLGLDYHSIISICNFENSL